MFSRWQAWFRGLGVNGSKGERRGNPLISLELRTALPAYVQDRLTRIFGDLIPPILAALAGCSDAAGASTQFETVLQLCNTAVQSISCGDGVAIGLQSHDEYVCRARCGAMAPPLGATVSPESSFTIACIRSGKTVVANRAATDEAFAPLAAELGINAAIAVPILDGSRVIGVLAVFSAHEDHFGEYHINAIQLMAELIGRAAVSSGVAERDKSGQREASALVVAGIVAEPSKPNDETRTAHDRIPTHQAAALGHATFRTRARLRRRRSPRRSGDLHSLAVQTVADPQSESTRGRRRVSDNADVPPDHSALPVEQAADSSCKITPTQVTLLNRERRRDSRIPVNDLLYVVLDNGNGGILLDISINGLCLQAVKPLEPKSRLEVQLASPEGFKLQTICSVAWASHLGTAGLRFTESTSDIAIFLRQFASAGGEKRGA